MGDFLLINVNDLKISLCAFLQLECCGSTSIDDWDRNIYFRCGAKTVEECGVPVSCCKIKDKVPVYELVYHQNLRDIISFEVWFVHVQNYTSQTQLSTSVPDVCGCSVIFVW